MRGKRTGGYPRPLSVDPRMRGKLSYELDYREQDGSIRDAGKRLCSGG